MKIVCPCCATGFPIEAGLVEGDAKRLGKLLGDMEPAVARAAMSYLRLFKPLKQELRVQRAVLVLTELAELINSKRISKDDRTGLYRPCAAQHWIQGMEQIQTHGRLELPLKNHNYLRAIVYGLADAADAKSEQQREKDRKQQRGGSDGLVKVAKSPLDAELELLRDWKNRGFFTNEVYDQKVREARQKYSNAEVAEHE